MGPAEISDDELVAEALAADPDAGVPDDAVSLWELDGRADGALLPDWYMPAAASSARRGWRRRVAVSLVATFLAINAAGLCSTYGHVVIA